jgi:DNA-binding NarL/FixJ family response regulator
MRVIIADDHPAFLEGLCTLIRMNYPEIEIVATAGNGREAVAATRNSAPELVVLDIRMPEMDGVEAASAIHRDFPEVKIVMLTTFNERKLVADALKVGAMGYILKETPVSELVDDIKQIYRGNLLLSRGAADVFSSEQETSESTAPAGEEAPTWPLNALPKEALYLTPREIEILRLLLSNYSNQRISEELCISPGTVRNYVSRIYATLRVRNRSGLYFWALDNNVR